MNGSGISRLRCHSIAPAAISKRVKCSCCRVIRSIGQFPQGSEVCVLCKPMPAGWRRGELVTVKFKEVA